jgi:hypothetical protein
MILLSLSTPVSLAPAANLPPRRRGHQWPITAGVVYTGSKVTAGATVISAAGVNDPGSRFATGVIVTGSPSCVANIFANFRKNLKWRLGIISGGSFRRTF